MEQGFSARLYWCSYLSRCVFGLVAWYLTRYLHWDLLQDALAYDDAGLRIAQDWLAGQPSSLLQSQAVEKAWVQIVLIAVIYFADGGIRLTPLVICIYNLITAVAPVYTYRIALELGAPSRAARLSGWITALSPAFVFWSGALYKEGLILVVLTLAVYHVLLLQKQWHPPSLGILALCLFAIYGLRFYLVIILVASCVLALLLGRSRSGEGENALGTGVRQIVIVCCFILGLFALGLTDRMQRLIPGDVSESLARMESSRADLAKADSGYLREATIASPQEALVYFPQGLLYFVTVPWPWQLGSFRQNIVAPETALWCLAYPLGIIGLKESLRRNWQGTLLLIVATASICCFYALWISNAGTAYRLRIQVWMLWSIFIAWGWVRLRDGDAAAE